MKSCLLLRDMTDEKQRLDINLIGVILMCVYQIRDPTFIANMRQIYKI